MTNFEYFVDEIARLCHDLAYTLRVPVVLMVSIGLVVCFSFQLVQSEDHLGRSSEDVQSLDLDGVLWNVRLST